MAVNQLKAGALLNYVMIGVNALVGIAYTPYLLRSLGKSEYGLYSLAASIIAYLTVLDLGFGNAIVRYTAKFRAENKIEKQYALFGTFTLFYSVIACFVLVVGAIIYCNFDAFFTQSLTAVEIKRAKIIVLLMVCNLAVTFPLSIYGAIITAYENFIFLRTVQICRIIMTTVVMIGLLTLGYKAIALAVVQTTFNILSLLLNVYYCRSKIRIKLVFGGIGWPLLREIMVYSFWIFLSAIVPCFYWYSGQFVLGATVGTVAIAVFAVADKLRMLYESLSTSISGVFLPKLTSMVARGESDKAISDIFTKTGRIQYAVLVYVLTGFILFGDKFISYWAGDGYGDSYIISLMFFIVLTVPFVQTLGIVILQARNQMKFRSILYLILAGACFGFQILLSPKFGAIGCAAATVGTLFVGQGIVMNIYYHIVQKIDILNFWIEILKMSVVPVVFMVSGKILLIYFPIGSLVQFCVFGIIFSIAYLPMFFFFSLNRFEKNLCTTPLRMVLAKFGYSK